MYGRRLLDANFLVFNFSKFSLVWNKKPNDVRNIHILFYITPLQSGLRPNFSHYICMSSGRDLHFKVNSERKMFENFFMAILVTPRVFARNLLRDRKSMKYFSYFVLFQLSDLSFQLWPHV